MRVKVAGRCLWTAIIEIIRFVLKSEITKGFTPNFSAAVVSILKP